jgi:predicted nucleic acid-binding protein
VRIYLDMCSLKRPFDDQSDPRIALETTAVLSILKAVAAGRAEAVRSIAHQVENSHNPDPRRSGTVGMWLGTLNKLEEAPISLSQRTTRLHAQGLGPLDAFHLAWAEHLKADVLVTTDDDFLSKASRPGVPGTVRVLNPVSLVGELSR